MENPTDISLRSLSKADLYRTVKVCEQLHQADANESFVLHCQHLMENLLSHVHFSAERQQINPFKMLEKLNDTVDEQYLPLFYEHVHEHPVVARLLSDPKSELYVTQLDSSVQQFKRSALYNEFYAQMESQHQLIICIVDDNELLLNAYSRDQEYTPIQMAMAHITGIMNFHTWQ